MIDFEEIKIFLPKYLSVSSEENLFENLKDFPGNIDTRMYSQYIDDNIIYQGDCLEGLLVTNFPDLEVKEANAMVLSNTCDLHLDNIRFGGSSVCYSPIINLDKYEKRLHDRNINSDRITRFLQSLRRQEISQIFFLPKGGKLESDSFILLDKINNCDNSSISREDINSKRIFSLSNYGLYLFLFKLSVHFSRIREGKDRDV